MAHYAEIDENNIVINVFAGVDEDDTTNLPSEFNSWEEFYTDLKSNTVKRTSYNTSHNEHLAGGVAFRGNYAGIGYTYDAENDVFIQPPKHELEVLNTTTWSYDPPNTKPEQPNENQDYFWNAEKGTWVLDDLKDTADFDWAGTDESNF